MKSVSPSGWADLRRPLKLWFVLMVSLSWGVLTGRCVTAEEILVAFWNVENLFDEFVDRRVPESDVFGRASVQEKLRKDATILRQLNADIVGLMEVENRGVLRELCQDHLDGLGYRYYALYEETDSRGIDVALVSRRPFMAYSFDVPEFDRGILAARFQLGGEPLYVVVNHWKSRFGGGEELRLNCARRVASLVQEIIPGLEGRPVPIIVGGDLNDDDTDASVVHLESIGLTNTLKDLPPETRWTLPYDNRDEQRVIYNGFDHILVNDELRDDTGLRWVQSQVVRPAIMTSTRRLYGQSYTWPDDDDRDHIGYSDHFPVTTRIRLP
jgi:endonuclease/exonuclease/phosphatase family metal-dependent hydrolase